MNIIQKIRAILFNEKLDMADKLSEIHDTLPKIEPAQPMQEGEIFGIKGYVKQVGSALIMDGSVGHDYIDNPRLANSDDIYYMGAGCTWGEDLDGNRYWKRYHSGKCLRSEYNHLNHGDIINEKARIKEYVKEALRELGY